MREFIQFGVLGLGLGAIYALISQGVVLVYRASGVLNLAHGGFALVGAYTYYEVHVRHGQAFIVGLLAAIVASVVVAAAFHTIVLRQMKHATSLAKVVATLALLTILQAGATLRYQALNFQIPSSLPSRTLHVDGVYLAEDRIWLLVIGCAVTAVLAAVGRWTLYGLATSAVAENERSAATLGWSPGQIALVNWCFGGALAAVAGVLVVPITGLNVTNMIYLVIPALAAALFGKFSSFGLTLVAALVIGVVESELTGYSTTPGLPEAVPFLAIVVLLVLRGQDLPVRGHVLEKLPSLGTGRIRWFWLIGLSAILGVVVYESDANVAAAVTVSLITAIFALSLVVLTGYAGQLSLAQFAFGGFGALVAGRVVARDHWPFILALPAGILAAALVGLILAIPAFRTRGINLALVTLGVGLAMQQVIFSNSDYTGGIDGTTVGPQHIFGFSIDPVIDPWAYGIFCLVVFVLCAITVANLRRGRSGRRLVAVRTNERAAASLGVNVKVAKAYAFMFSAALAGVAGILLGFSTYSIVYDQYDPLHSIGLISSAFVGGVGYVLGPVFGSLLASGGWPGGIITSHIGNFGEWLVLAGGVFLLFVLVQDPNGLAAQNIALAKAVVGKLRPRRQVKPATSRADLASGDSVETAGRVSPKTLEVRDVAVYFGPIHAVDGVSVTVAPGQVVAVIGPNGAGKTTLIDAITGFASLHTGSISLDAVPVQSWPASRRARAGMVRSFQSLELFDDLTVLENLLAASERRDLAAYLTDPVWVRKSRLGPAALAAIDDFNLWDDLDTPVQDLSYGKRRLVAIARTAATEASVLLLDEPAAGLSDTESMELGRLIRKLADERGVGILLVEHDMSLVMSISDAVVALNFGAMIAEGTPAEVRRSPAVVAAYLGTEEGAADDDAAPVIPSLPTEAGSDGIAVG